MNKVIHLILFGAICAFFASTPSYAQSISLLKRVPLPSTPVDVSIDRNEHIFIADNKGNVNKYGIDGTLLFTYSPNRPGKIQSIEAWSTLNILVFYEGLQEFRFLNRFLVSTATNQLSPDIFARLMTTSTDNNLWVFDDKDYSLKKLNINLSFPEIVAPLNNVIHEDFNGAYLREYQNLLFLSDINTGIYVFDNLGNYIRMLSFPEVSYFNFLSNELYYLTDSSVTFYNLYSAESRNIALPSEQSYSFALASEKYLYLIAKKHMDIYTLAN